MDFHFNGSTKDSSNAGEGAGNHHGLTPKRPRSDTQLPAQCQVTSCPLSHEIITLLRRQRPSFQVEAESGSILKREMRYFEYFQFFFAPPLFLYRKKLQNEYKSQLANLGQFRFH